MVRPITTKALLQIVGGGFEKIEDHRAANVSISLRDALMSGFAIFSLKDSSLLEFDKRRFKDENLKNIYGLERIPSDTQMRTILDSVSPEGFRPIFKEVYQDVEEKGILRQMKFMGHYLVNVDGSGYFSSQQVHCEKCCNEKTAKRER